MNFVDIRERQGTYNKPETHGGHVMLPHVSGLVKGQVLTGTAETPRGSQTIDDGKVNDNKIVFNTTVNGNVIKHEGTARGNTIQLQNKGPFGRFDVVLKRVSTTERKSAQQ